MKHFYRLGLFLSLLVQVLLRPAVAVAAPFTPGNIIVARVGQGGTALLTSAATAIFLDEYTPAGTLVQSVALPTVVSGTNYALTASGTSNSALALVRTVNKQGLVLAGYGTTSGASSASVASSAASDAVRVVGLVGADGSVKTTSLSSAFSGSNVLSVASVDGMSFYVVGNAASGFLAGVQYVALGGSSPTQLTTTAPTNLRVVNIVDGNLYVSSLSGTAIGLSSVGTCLPTAGQTITLLPGSPGNAGTSNQSPYGFYFADLSSAVAGVDVVCVVDSRTSGADGSGIQKWSLVGGTWVLNGSISNATTSHLTGIEDSVAGAAVSSFATSGTSLFALIDNTGYNVAPTITTLPAAIATAATNTVFRGVAFAPSVPVPTIASFTPTSGVAGATVTVTGTDFTGATAVTLNGVAITGFTVVNSTTTTFAVPTGATSGPIAVTTAGGTATSTSTFTVMPAITALSPSVQVAGGPAFTLTITGTNFTPASTVNFNNVSYTPTSATATTLVVTIPASMLSMPGTYPVSVTTVGGTSNVFTFRISNASTAGAYENFEAGTKSSYAAGPLTLTSGVWTFVNALIGDSFADKFNGLKSVRIRTGGAISMNFDKSAGAGTVVINAALYGTAATGASFLLEQSADGGTTYTPVAGAPAMLTYTLTPYIFTVNTAGNVRFRISNTVTTTTTSAPRINIDDISIGDYTAPPTITSFTPTTGGPGTMVTLTGTNLTGATSVRIGTFVATSFTVVSGTSITFVVPNGTGSVNGFISVTTPGGTATSTTPFNLVSATLAANALPGLLVFPNPATDRLTVELPTSAPATVALRDLAGRLVLAPAALGADHQLRLPAALASGVYLLEVRQGATVAIRRIEKN